MPSDNSPSQAEQMRSELSLLRSGLAARQKDLRNLAAEIADTKERYEALAYALWHMESGFKIARDPSQLNRLQAERITSLFTAISR